MSEFSLHPVIRIVSLLVLASAVALGGVMQWLVGVVLMVAVYLPMRKSARHAALRMLRRARWLLLSIAVVYLWFTPGTPLWSSAPPGLWAWLPTAEGVQLGALRVGALVVIIMAVNALLMSTSQTQLLAALHTLATPLAWCGIARERIAVRTTLTLMAVTEIGDMMATPRAGRGPWYERAGMVASSLFQGALARADSARCDPITIPAHTRVPPWQWLVPALVAVLMSAL